MTDKRTSPPEAPEDARAPAPRVPETPIRTPERPFDGGAPGVLTREAPAQIDPIERAQPQVGGRGSRSLALTPEIYDATGRTVEAVLSAGSPVRRYYFTEELEISAEAIDLGRVHRGICPLLDTHNQYTVDAQLGRITDVRIDGAQLVGTLHFNDTEAGRAVEARVAAGELRAISIGYRVTKWQISATDDTDHETWRAVAWELLEASLVPVPADPNAVVRSAPGPLPTESQEDEGMRRNLPGGPAPVAPVTPPAPTTGPLPPPLRRRPRRPRRTLARARPASRRAASSSCAVAPPSSAACSLTS